MVFWLVAGLFPGSVTSQHLAETSRTQIAKVEHLVDQGRFVEAFQEAQTAQAGLQLPTGRPDTLAAQVYFWLGKCQALLMNEQVALRYLDSALQCIDALRDTRFFQIEAQYALLKKDEGRLRAAVDFFVNSPNRVAKAESMLLLATLQLRQKPGPPTLTLLQQALDIAQASGIQAATLTARLYQSLGFYEWKINTQIGLGLEYFLKAETIYLQKGGPKSNYLAALYINLGACRDELGQTSEALRLYKNAERNLLGQNPNHPFFVNLYNNAGTTCRELGEYATAIQYLENVTRLAPNDGRYWNNLGEAYRSFGDKVRAENCFKKAISLLINAKNAQFQLARPYHNLGILYRELGQTDSALMYEFRSLPLRKTNPNAFLDIARSYQGIGECYLIQKKWADALQYLDSAQWLQHRAIPSGLNGEIATNYLSKTRCLMGLGQFAPAMALADSALQACGYTRKGHFGEAIAPTELLAALEQKGQLYFQQYQITRNENLLLSAELAFDTAALAVRFFRNNLIDSESRAVLAGQFRDILSGGVEAALAMHQLHPNEPVHFARAFAFSEQSKALVLLEGVRSSGVTKFEGISDSLLDLERSLRQAVTYAEVDLHKMLERGKILSDSQIIKAKNEVFKRQREFEAFQRGLLSGEFAQYHAFRYDLSLATPEEIQLQWLKPGRCLVSYFVKKDGKVTAFVIQKKGVSAVECPGGEKHEAWVRELREGLSGYYTLPSRKRNEALFEKTLKQYTSAAFALYSCLIAPLEQQLDLEVVIVPDGELSKIPFESLLTSIPSPEQITDFVQYPYWFKKQSRTLSYAYSATLLREMLQKKHRKNPVRPLIAFAPFFPGTRADLGAAPLVDTQEENRKGFNPLVFSGQEVRDISRICQSPDWWVGQEASKTQFLRFASTARVLHLSTHGVLDSAADYSYLAFVPDTTGQSEPLFVRELYSLQLNADLVTLSACETGLGKHQAGEGVISLARAFSYAGAKSIVMSLWQVNDAATKDLMTMFYENLVTGKSKDSALRDAKLKYLNTHMGERAHPFFWAGMVGVGSTEAIELK